MKLNVIITNHAKKRFSERAGVPLKGRNGLRSPLQRKVEKAFKAGKVLQDDEKGLRVLLNDFVFVFIREEQKLILVTVEKGVSEHLKYYKKGKMATLSNRHYFELAA